MKRRWVAVLRMKKRRVKLGIPGEDNSDYALHLSHVGQKAQIRIAKAFLDIIHLLCEREQGVAREHKKQLIPVSYVLRELGAFDSDVPPKLRELWDAIGDGLVDAWRRGEESGASLLKQLAAGKTTIERYNEIAITGETDDDS